MPAALFMMLGAEAIEMREFIPRQEADDSGFDGLIFEIETLD